MIASLTVMAHHRRRNPRILCALVAVVTAAAAGCSGGPSKPVPLQGSNLGRLAMIYTLYLQNNRTPLTNEQDLVTYAKSLKPEGVKAMGIDVTQVEQYFTSPRDGKPYRLILKVQGGDPANPPPVAYEQVGVNGKREVGFLFGKVEEVDEARFRQLVPTR